jgi:hypothetical protein
VSVSDTVTSKLSDNPADYLTGPTSGDSPTEGGTTKDGQVAKMRTAGVVRPVEDSPSESGSSES